MIHKQGVLQNVIRHERQTTTTSTTLDRRRFVEAKWWLDQTIVRRRGRGSKLTAAKQTENVVETQFRAVVDISTRPTAAVSITGKHRELL